MKLLLSTLPALLGFFIIYYVWRLKEESRLSKTTKLFFGWVLVLTSVYVMTIVYGTEYGLTYALFGLTAIPLTLTFANIDVRKKNQLNAMTSYPLKINLSKSSHNLLSFIIVVPVGFILSIVSSLLISQLLPWQTVNQLTFVIFVFPLLWAVVSYLYLYSEKRLKTALKLISITTITALLASI